MRLDKFFTTVGLLSRREVAAAVRRGQITVNGTVAKAADMKVDPEADAVTLAGEAVIYREFVYLWLNKPEGYVSATEDGREKTVLDLIPPESRARGLFPCGRLDKNTLGLMLLTDNGDLAHRLLAPKSHVAKVYRFKSKFPVSVTDAERFEAGLTLEDGYETKPAKIQLEGDGDEGLITLVEGKYHQIKRMLEALDNKITYLERLRFGPLTLDPDLERGQWRYLTAEEIEQLEKHDKL
jgi:16S rRNA pseudouridine516 synthase